MAYALVGTPVAAFSPAGSGTFTSGTMDTSGATLLVVCYGDDGTVPTLTDSNTNTWTQAINTASPMAWHSAIFYCWGTPSVGAGHTMTLTGAGIAASAQFWAFSGAETGSDPINSTPVGDVAFSSLTIAPGPITPNDDDSLVVIHVVGDVPGGATISGGFASPAVGSPGVGGQYVGSHSSYLIQTTATASDPTMTHDNSGHLYGTMATFKAGAGGGDGDPTGVSVTFRHRHDTRPRPYAPGLGR
jgi:hypothetical protein